MYTPKDYAIFYYDEKKYGIYYLKSFSINEKNITFEKNYFIYGNDCLDNDDIKKIEFLHFSIDDICSTRIYENSKITKNGEIYSLNVSAN